LVAFADPSDKPYTRPTIMVLRKKQRGGKQEIKRTACKCQAISHTLVNNCLKCGKIVCSLEGPGPCFFCGNIVAPKGEEATYNYEGVDENTRKAIEQKDKLIENDKSSNRNTVLDDQEDYYDLNSWMTPEERQRAKKKHEEAEKQKKESKNKITIDFAGRRVISEDESFNFKEEMLKEITKTGSDFRVNKSVQSNGIKENEDTKDQSTGAFRNPTISVPQPQFVYANKDADKTDSKNPKSTKNKRVQHEFFPDEITDQDTPMLSNLTPDDTRDDSSDPPCRIQVPIQLDVPGLTYYPNWLTEEEEQKLLRIIDSSPWNSKLQRQTQHYGYEYNYNAKDYQDINKSRLSVANTFPKWLTNLAKRLSNGITPHLADQVIINEYTPGQGINPHIDHKASFQDCVVSLSLGSGTTMSFAHYATKKNVSQYLEPRSLIVLSGEARYNWSHGIAAIDSDLVNGRKIHRGRRVSITFRKIIEQEIKQ